MAEGHKEEPSTRQMGCGTLHVSGSWIQLQQHGLEAG